MPGTLPAGPYRTVTLTNGDSAPFYVIPFDKRGVCEAPQTREHVLKAVAAGDFSDVFLFSHGWNNDWTVATNRYNDFLAGFMKMRSDFSLADPGAGYRPLLVGVFWPSTALAFGAAEEGPDMAGAEASVGREQHDLAELGAALSPEAAARFFDLAQRELVTLEEAREMAAMFAELAGGAHDDLPGAGPTPAEVEESIWGWFGKPEDRLDDFATADDIGGDLQAAGVLDLLKKLDPRPLVRAFTVWQMKDRAGTVGANGLGPLLRDLLARTAARVHLVGHSFGAKVMMSAVCAAPLTRNVTSALLLQGAMSHLCFAERVPGTNAPGGYRPALDRVDGRIVATFSSRDVPLTKFFHVALRRARDRGELQALGGEPPSLYAALGGYGPRGAAMWEVDILDPVARYAWPPGTKLVAIRGDRTITGHGDISNRSTWWALYSGAFRHA